MMKKLIPLVFPVIGLGAGVGAGLFLGPGASSVEQPPSKTAIAAADKPDEPAQEGAAHGPQEPATAEGEQHAAGDQPDEKPEFVKLTNQFVVPLLQDDRVVSLVILSLNLEVEAGKSEDVYAREPKLRDAFLQVLFDHANAGGFRGSFTDGSNLIYLRRALLERAQGLVGAIVTDVLISDIARQDS